MRNTAVYVCKYEKYADILMNEGQVVAGWSPEGVVHHDNEKVFRTVTVSQVSCETEPSFKRFRLTLRCLFPTSCDGTLSC